MPCGVSGMFSAGLALLGIGLLLHVVGTATSAWSTKNDFTETDPPFTVGPFIFCTECWLCNGFFCYDTSSIDTIDIYIANDFDGTCNQPRFSTDVPPSFCRLTKFQSTMQAVRAMTVIGALLGFAGLVIGILLFVFAAQGKSIQAMLPSIHAMLPRAIAALTIGAFVFVLLGVIIWGAVVQNDNSDKTITGSSFWLSITGGLFIVIGGILAAIGSPST